VRYLYVLPKASQPFEPLCTPGTPVSKPQLVQVNAPVAPHVSAAPQLFSALLAL
jgi:hypothetical protein